MGRYLPRRDCRLLSLADADDPTMPYTCGRPGSIRDPGMPSCWATCKYGRPRPLTSRTGPRANSPRIEGEPKPRLRLRGQCQPLLPLPGLLSPHIPAGRIPKNRPPSHASTISRVPASGFSRSTTTIGRVFWRVRSQGNTRLSEHLGPLGFASPRVATRSSRSPCRVEPASEKRLQEYVDLADW